MLIQLLLLILGLILLIKGADWLVDGSSTLAKKHNMSDLAVGLTIVAFGTSAPELIVNSYAAAQNHHDIVFGNIIGSNIFNLFAILGIAGVLTPIVVQSTTVWKEIPISMFAILILFVMGNEYFSPGTARIGRLEGFILLACFLAFLYYVYKQLRSDTTEVIAVQKHLSNVKIWSLIAIGLLGLVAGGRLVVVNAIEMAQTLGVSEKIIGLTIVAAGTSLPELATSIVAALRKNNNIAVGNIIGSNIFNIFLILSVSALIRPLEYDVQFNEALYLLAGGTLLLFFTMFTGKRKKLDRWEAFIFLFCFIGYTVYMISKEI